MSGSASLTLEQGILQHTLGIAAMAFPTQVYVALCAAGLPPSESVGGVEAFGGGYSRVAATFALLASPTNIAANTASVEFPLATAAWGSLGYFEIWTAQTGGSRLYWGGLVDPVSGNATTLDVSAGDIVRFSAGTLAVEVAAPTVIEAAGVSSFNTRIGPVTLSNSDVVAVLPPSANPPLMDGVAAVGTSAMWARGDHVHPSEVGAFNVKTFGAVGDGTTDDTAAIKAAVAAGGSVYFPPGIYKVSGTSTILPSGTRVYGAGSMRSIIRPSGLTTWTAAGGGTESPYVFCNTNTNTYGTFTFTRTSPSVQTDVGISIEGLGFDFSQQSGPAIGNFVFSRRMYINDVRAGNGALPTAPGFTGFRLIGCDEVLISNVAMTNITQGIDCWKGCTRIKVQNISMEVATNAVNGAAINFNGVGTQQTQEFASDLQVENATIWLHNDIAFYLDSMPAGSSTTDVLMSNIRIVALDGNTNTVFVGRGRGGRIKVHNIAVTAASGAAYLNIALIGADFGSMSYTATNLIATTSGSPLITVTLPDTTTANTLTVGPGNYLIIDNGSGGAVVGNGLSLSGYYLVTAVSGPISSTQSGNVVTATVGANATATGTIAASAHVQGYIGCFSDCEFVGITLDGVGCAGYDLFSLNGAGHRISDVTVTQNYNGFATPQYRSIINIDGTLVHDQTWRPIYVSNIVAAPGTGALQAGWHGDNLIQWQPFGPVPIVSNVQTAGGDYIVGKSSAGATTDDSGHLLIPFVAGQPTTAPTNAAKGIAIRYDTTNHKLWAYDNGTSTWRGVVLT